MHADTYPSAEAYLDAGPHRGLDCLILDIELGGMSGIELCEHLRSAGVQAPVIFLTAHEGPEWRERAERAGCAAFFTKSEAGDVVLAAIDRTVTSARAMHARGESRTDAESVPPSAP